MERDKHDERAYMKIRHGFILLNHISIDSFRIITSTSNLRLKLCTYSTRDPFMCGGHCQALVLSCRIRFHIFQLKRKNKKVLLLVLYLLLFVSVNHDHKSPLNYIRDRSQESLCSFLLEIILDNLLIISRFFVKRATHLELPILFCS